MLLKSLDGSEFEATIAGYEFPGIEHEKWDSNWLLVSMQVKSPRGEGTCVDPCLETWDVERLIKWLEALANDEAVEPDIGFLEPNLAFEVIKSAKDAITLRVRFILERKAWWKPTGGKRHRSSRWRDYVDLEVGREDVRLAAEAWRADLSRFPLRT
jgi:hypothetical protein